MWVVLLVGIHLLVGPSVSVLSDFGPYRSRSECETDLSRLEKGLGAEDRAALAAGELAVVCVAVADYRTLTEPPQDGAAP